MNAWIFDRPYFSPTIYLKWDGVTLIGKLSSSVSRICIPLAVLPDFDLSGYSEIYTDSETNQICVDVSGDAHLPGFGFEARVEAAVLLDSELCLIPYSFICSKNIKFNKWKDIDRNPANDTENLTDVTNYYFDCLF